MKPIRCYTCGKVLGNKWMVVDRLQREQMPLKQIYEKIGISRYCCKRIILSSVDDSLNNEYIVGDNIKIHRTNPNSNFMKII